MKLRELEVLHAILQTGSVTAAAKLLNVSQPSVSTVLQHAEAQLGMQLFERTGGRLKASPEAEALLPEIRDVFRRVDRISRNARSLARGRLGRINIAGTLALANGYIVDAVSVFVKQYPEVDVTIHSLQTPDIIERVVARELNLGVCYGSISNGALQVEELTAHSMICVMPKDHRLAEKPFIEVSDLLNETLITYEDGDWLRNKVDGLFAAVGEEPHISLQVSQTITALRLVSEDGGLALVEPFYFAATRPEGLVAKPVRPEQSLTVELIRPIGVVESAAVSAFVDILRGITANP
ncbi:LysR family transcriptional regulator [Agrobacterium larrymoorei]|uniref:LysR family transcriptional regulator n=1 Tax=Agrobacterium larrymoorei TaxID=160699 RepID=A0AAF0KK84_9HYPH|nr:LysR family transcriptional regulator [Agrobacterium larrymoorei]WHA44009.1 LysR family transcriptional regulator [Agrobacterium larrymoorei]